MFRGRKQFRIITFAKVYLYRIACFNVSSINVGIRNYANIDTKKETKQ